MAARVSAEPAPGTALADIGATSDRLEDGESGRKDGKGHRASTRDTQKNAAWLHFFCAKPLSVR